MKRDLETLKDILWQQFEKAVEKHDGYYGNDYSSEYYPTNFTIESNKSIGILGQAIAEVEREIREQQQARPLTIDKPKGKAI